MKFRLCFNELGKFACLQLLQRSVFCIKGFPGIFLNSFFLRLPLHRDWSALRDDELCKVSGIPGCIFVHANLFIGGNVSYEGALQMAVKSLAARG